MQREGGEGVGRGRDGREREEAYEKLPLSNEIYSCSCEIVGACKTAGVAYHILTLESVLPF